jgi:hypothetical protein
MADTSGPDKGQLRAIGRPRLCLVDLPAEVSLGSRLRGNDNAGLHILSPSFVSFGCAVPGDTLVQRFKR